MIVFVSNFLNQHQYPLAKELYQLLGNNYKFIETEPTPDIFINTGYSSFEQLPFLIKAWQSPQNKHEADKLILGADCAILDDFSDTELIKKRLCLGKLTLQCGERWLKKGLLNLLSPRLIKYQWFYHTFLYNKPIYMLCASAFAAKDLRQMRSFRNRCFKWGYFTKVENLNPAQILSDRKNEVTSFISIARLIGWKGHLLTIEAAKTLRDQGLNFKLDIYGDGLLKGALEKRISKYGLSDIVQLKGTLSNNILIKKIRQYDAFILSSNRQEGWGAVVNEAMANVCPVIGSDKIGSVPYLITDGQNGLIFKSGNYKSLASKMKALIQSHSIAEKLAVNAYETMLNEWSPSCAAKHIVTLIDNLLTVAEPSIQSGPCSPA